MNVGNQVRVIAAKGEWSGAANPFFGMVGTLEKMNMEKTNEGGYEVLYGVRLQGQRMLFFFWSDELTVIEEGGENLTEK